METQAYKITIDAPKEKVWNTLWEDATYRQWTAPFAEGSHAETDWKQGSKILFTDGKGSGMISTVAENKPNEFMGIKHLGMIKDGVEDYDSEEIKAWAGSYENYTLKSVGGKTELFVDMGTPVALPKEMADYFAQAWPKALDKLKEIAEKN